jgi:hypothetical protein
MTRHARVLLACGAMAAAACGSSTAPTPVLIVTGSLQLHQIGETSQLRASEGGTDVTDRAVWQSASTAVATVSGGLVTATGFGSTRVSATYQGATGSTAIQVVSATSIADCQTISEPGQYQVSTA